MDTAVSVISMGSSEGSSSVSSISCIPTSSEKTASRSILLGNHGSKYQNAKTNNKSMWTTMLTSHGGADSMTAWVTSVVTSSSSPSSGAVPPGVRFPPGCGPETGCEGRRCEVCSASPSAVARVSITGITEERCDADIGKLGGPTGCGPSRVPSGDVLPCWIGSPRGEVGIDMQSTPDRNFARAILSLALTLQRAKQEVPSPPASQHLDQCRFIRSSA